MSSNQNTSLLKKIHAVISNITLSPAFWTPFGLTLIPRWVRNRMPNKVWTKITYFQLQRLQNWCLRLDKQFRPTLCNECYYDEVSVKRDSKRGSRSSTSLALTCPHSVHYLSWYFYWDDFHRQTEHDLSGRHNYRHPQCYVRFLSETSLCVIQQNEAGSILNKNVFLQFVFRNIGKKEIRDLAHSLISTELFATLCLKWSSSSYGIDILIFNWYIFASKNMCHCICIYMNWIHKPVCPISCFCGCNASMFIVIYVSYWN